MFKRIIVIVFAYVGIATGAGLASGQEIMQFFISFGKYGLFGLIGVTLLHTILGGIILVISSSYRAKTHNEVIEQISHPIGQRIFDIALILTSFIIGFVMLAGAGSNLHQQFGLDTWVGAAICAILVILVSRLDFEKVSRVIGSFTPLIFIFILIALVYSIINKSYEPETVAMVSAKIPSTLPNWWISTINYFDMCIMVGASMFFVLGGDELNPKAAKIAGFLGGGTVGFLTFALGMILFLNIQTVYDVDLPTQLILNNIHPVLGFLMSIIIFGMIFNTAIGLFYSLARRFSKDDKSFNYIIIVVVGLGFALSFFGFKELVSIMYPILGYLGIILVINLIYVGIRDKNLFKKEQLIRNLMFKRYSKKYDTDEDFTHKDRKLINKLAEKSVVDNKDIKEDMEELVKDSIEEEEE